MLEKDHPTNQEIDGQRLEVLREYMLLAQRSNLPLDVVIAKDFHTLLSRAIMERPLVESHVLTESNIEYHFETSYGPFHYNPATCEVISPLLPEKDRVILSKRQGEMLNRLLATPSKVISKESLLDLVEGEKREATLNVRISNLRKKIGDLPENDDQGRFRLIHTFYNPSNPIRGIYFGPVKPS